MNVIGILLLTFGGFAFLVRTSSFLAGVVLLGLAGFWVYGVNRGQRAQGKTFAKSREEWQRAVDRWSGLSYCSRCDGVFDPLTGEFRPTDRMDELLSR